MANRPQAKGLAESAVGLLLLALLVVVAAGVLLKQSHYDRQIFDVQRQPGDSQTSADPAGQVDLAAILPAGFEPMTPPETYTPDTLYEKINGKAELYLNSGFVSLWCRRFVSTADETTWGEIFIYDMGSDTNAFAVYSAQKRADAQPLQDLRFGYTTADAVFAAKGKYYIEVIGQPDAPDLLSAMRQATKSALSQVGAQQTQIAELSLFPQENLVTDSFGLQITGAFGYQGLTNTFTAKYKFDGETVTIFLSRRADEQAAAKLAESYYQFLKMVGAKELSPGADFDIPGGRIAELYDSVEVIFTDGPFVAGVHSAPSREAAAKAAKMLYAALTGASER